MFSYSSRRWMHILLSVSLVLALFQIHNLILINDKHGNLSGNGVNSKNDQKTSSYVPSISIPVRAFPTWYDETNGLPLPCVINHNESQTYTLRVQNQPSKTGILFIKIEKAGSSTLAGVQGRIGHVVYLNQLHNKTLINEDGHRVTEGVKPNAVKSCKLRGMQHSWGFPSWKTLLTRNETRFLWSIVRRPEDRIISQYFHFNVSRLNSSTSDEDIIEFLQISKNHNRQTQYLYPNLREIKAIQKIKDPIKRNLHWQFIVARILRSYNFIGTLERLDESLVLLQIIMGLKPSDVIPLTAKQSTRENELDMNSRGQCNTYVKSFVSPGVKAFLDSYVYFRRYHESDYMLYEAVDKSMDATIDLLGRVYFETQLENFRRAKKFAEENNCTYVSPCLSEGVLRPWKDITQMCYLADAGCGHNCLDQLFGT